MRFLLFLLVLLAVVVLGGRWLAQRAAMPVGLGGTR